jgi:hypothetical protein
MTDENEPVFIGWYQEDAYGPNSEEMMFESLGVETVTIQRPDWEEAGCPNPIAIRFEQATTAEIEAYSGYMNEDDEYPDDDAEGPQIESSQAVDVPVETFKQPYHNCSLTYADLAAGRRDPECAGCVRLGS